MAFLTARRGIGERGQALVEYAALIAVVGVAIVAILGLVSRATENAYHRTANSVAIEAGGRSFEDGGAGAVQIIPAGSRPPSDSASADPDSTGTAQAR